MDGVSSAHEAMKILNDTTLDVLTITTLKGIPLPTSPVTGFAYPEKHRMVNSCSQTEQERLMTKAASDDYERRYLTSNIGERSVYKVSKSVSGEKAGGISTAWDNIREKIARGRKHSKDREEKKKRHRNSSPNASAASAAFEQEQQATEAIAELDSVIESEENQHHKVKSEKGGGAAGVVLKRSKRRAGAEKSEKNGGTWPKARGGPLVQNGTGTILHSRKTKERLPLSVLINQQPPKYESYTSYNRISNPIPLASFSNVNNRHTVYKAMESHLPNFSQVFGYKSFAPAMQPELKKDMVELGPAPSETSIDLHLKHEYSSKKRAGKYDPHPGDDAHHSAMLPVPGQQTPHSRVFSQAGPRHAGNYSFPTYVHSHPHPHQIGSPLSSSRYPSPPSLPSAQSGESIGLPDARSFCFEPPYSPGPQPYAHHLHTPSIDLHYHKARVPYDLVPASYTPGYEGGTFPRKKENQRFRIPSNPSVTSKSSAGKLSTGSIERTSERGSPTFYVEVLSPGTGGNDSGSESFVASAVAASAAAMSKRSSVPEYCYTQATRSPAPGELRRVHIDKTVEPLGFNIAKFDSRGVFVSTVTEHSLASQVGLQIGDQLLEVCGINMRSATYDLAAHVLRQCGNSITMLVQYSPDSE